MKIKWIGHSCFQIEEKGYQIVIDPFNPLMLPNIGKYDVSANEILCSHEHDDHNYREGVNLLDNSVLNPFEITHLVTYHDHVRGKKRGNNIIHILETDNYKLAHFGDLGSDLTPDHINKLRNLDFLFIPVGGFFTINADEAKKIVDKLNPKHVIPMHYKGQKTGFEVLSTVNDFLKYFKKSEIKHLKSNELVVNHELKELVIIFEI